ncbi:MAG TPA: type IV pilus assembly protein PilM [Patescibacteria group bacterium]|nr:type IV pilus assembly protein PilM [Patescibacteria group bacterium]
MVGIDIGSKSIKVIEAKKSSNSWQLLVSGAVGFNGTAPEKMIAEDEFAKAGELLKKTVSQIKISSKDVNIGLPERLVFSRVIKFPMLTDEEVVAAIKWEAEQYIPIPLNEAVIQHVVLEKKENPAEILVLLIAVPKTIVEKYIKIVRLAGLNPISAETELIALSRSLAPATGTSLILDLGANSTNMAIVKNSKIYFTRSIPVAGEAFTRAVSQGMGVTPEQAEEYKKTYGLSTSQLEGKIKNALDPVMRMVVDEIKKAIHFYQTEGQTEMPSSVILTGGASFMPEIQSYLTDLLSLETVIGDPFSKFTIDSETAKSLIPYSSYYGTAAGLAMREE